MLLALSETKKPIVILFHHDGVRVLGQELTKRPLDVP